MLALALALTASASAPLDPQEAPGPHAAHLAEFGHLPRSSAPLRMPRGSATPGPHMTVYGYLAYWDDDLNIVPWDELSHIAIFQADVGTNGSLSNTSRLSQTAAAVAMGAPYGVRVHICVTNFNSTELATLLSSASARATLVANLKSWVDNTGAHGVNIDFEGLPASQRQNMVTFVDELAAANVGDIVLATPAVDWSDAWDYAALTARADLFIMGYGYHWTGGNPGPGDPLYGGGIWPAWSLDWSARDYVETNGGDPSRIILGLPLYGISWPVSNPTTVPATRTGNGSSIFWVGANADAATNGRRWDSSSLSPWFATSTRQSWYPDVESVRYRVQYASNTGLQGIGFWALNYDDHDDALWTMIREETTEDPPVDTGAADSGAADTGAADTGSADSGGEDTGTAATGDLVAHAGQPFLAYPGDPIRLDGSRSTGPADMLFEWTQVGGPSVALQDVDTPNPTFRAREPGTHIFALRVGDGEAWSTEARSHVVVLDEGMGAGGCGCTSSGLVGGWLALVPLVVSRRRRRATSGGRS